MSSDGGAVLIAAGPDYASDGSLYDTPLSPVLPVAPTGTITEKPFHARVTDTGEKHPVTRGLEGRESRPAAVGPLVPRHRRRQARRATR